MSDLASLQTQLDATKSAYHSGVLTANYNGKSVTYRSASEMQQVIGSLEQEIAALEGTPMPKSVTIRSSKGW